MAAFTLKNAFVADYMHQTPFFGDHSRRQFKERRRLPLGMYMWFSSVATARNVKHGIYKARYGKPTIHSPLGVETYVFTWSAESLFLQLVAARWTNVLNFRDGWPDIWQEDRLNSTFIPFWPIKRSRLSWPTKNFVSHNHLEMAADRFTSIRFH